MSRFWRTNTPSIRVRRSPQEPRRVGRRLFDANTISFVSVTQQFNTTTSMGRLTLNVLLSFAQFEREVTAERIRDKIAASKKKGMWMGGTVPFGYRVENRKLVIDEAAASEVRKLFRRYLELGSVPALVRELNDRGTTTDRRFLSLLHADTGQGRRRPAKAIGKGKLYYMLSNPIYIGRVRHGGNVYPGEHEPIIEKDVFEAVQRKLAEQAPRERGTPVQRDIHLLNGLLFDETGDRLSPIHAGKAGKRYRYYISSRLKAGNSGQTDGWRIPASEIEAIVLQHIRELLADRSMLSGWLQNAGHAASIELGLARAGEASCLLKATASSKETHAIIRTAIRRIDLASNRIRIAFDGTAIASWLAGAASQATASDADLHILNLPLSIRQRGVERRLVIEGQGASLRRYDQPLIDMVARAHAYLETLTNGQGLGRKDVAKRFGVHPEDVSRVLPLAFLSPRIVEAVLTGQQPADLSVRHLARNIELPIAWADQSKVLGI
ncbi:MAG: recombinase family protein [Aquamicrobium sp.]|uniref:recombinase family protein n=1 Tax=Aquamicrobium sp. TaxID=1872579 RepID=UPI00349E7574|nr:recombinase family protein [Aquamicrobium sp.]